MTITTVRQFLIMTITTVMSAVLLTMTTVMRSVLLTITTVKELDDDYVYDDYVYRHASGGYDNAIQKKGREGSTHDGQQP